MKITVFPKVLYRTPRFPMNAVLSASWAELKASIKISSPDFYRRISAVSEDGLNDLPDEVRHTIWKYFNRAKLRSTPYGSFAGAGLAGGMKYADGILNIGKELRLHFFEDWRSARDVHFYGPLDARQKLFSNSTYYRCLGSLRYIFFADGSFQLTEIRRSGKLEAVLKKCRHPALLADLLRRGGPGMLCLIYEMLELQLLFTGEGMPIIGNNGDCAGSPLPEIKPGAYIVAERRYRGGNLDLRHFRNVPRLVSLLGSLGGPQSTGDLREFARRLAGRFDQRFVPLMLALDPVLGVGYGSFDSRVPASVAPFLDVTEQRDSVLKMLEGKIMSAACTATHSPIDLESVLEGLPPGPGGMALPNTIGMLCSVCDGNVIVDYLGGATVNSIAGRFTLLGDGIRDYCRELAALEQEANPDVVFFDVAYAGEPDINNISRRQQIYDYQLSILNYDTSADPLSLTDILVGVRGGEVVLFSEAIGKRLVPRIASAYNYGRSDLSVFRLLGDLQHQAIQSNLLPDLMGSLSTLDFQPRLHYRNIVLSPAKWRIGYAGLQAPGFCRADISGLKQYLGRQGIGRYCLIRTADRTLCFDTEDAPDLEALLFILKKFRSFVIEEAFIPERPLVRDEDGNPYMGQFLVSLVHSEVVYRGVEMPAAKSRAGAPPAVFLPGGQWLYLEIFMESTQSDDFLRYYLAPFLMSRQKEVLCWFFIRYNEQGEHIRLRIMPSHPNLHFGLLRELTCSIDGLLKQGVVSDMSVRTYRRELERYGPQNMEGVERHFCSDSIYVLFLLKSRMDLYQLYRLSIDLILVVLGRLFRSDGDVARIIGALSASYAAEHALTPSGFKALNAQYRKIVACAAVRLSRDTLGKKRNFEDSFVRTVREARGVDKEQLFADMMHMHINRIFPSHQRTHEMIIYYGLAKKMKLAGALGRSGSKARTGPRPVE